MVVLGANIPLILRKVPRNETWGMRFAVSMKSDEAWYAINEYGGKLLAGGSLLILLAGVLGLISPPASLAQYLWISTGTSVLGIFGPVIWLYMWARKHWK